MSVVQNEDEQERLMTDWTSYDPPEFVVEARLLCRRNAVVTSVPFHLD